MTTATLRRVGPSLRPDEVLTAIGLGAFFVAVWPLLHALQAPGPPTLTVLVAHVCGMLAGYAVVVMVALMSRAPALEHGVGADRLARWHAAGGRVVLTLVVLHAWAAVAAWAHSRREGMLLALWHVLRMPWLLAATVGTLLLVAVAVLSVRAARQRVSYETWHTLHLLTYVAVAMAFVHQLAGPDLAGHRVLQVAWAGLYTGVAAVVLQYRVLLPLAAAQRHRMRVSHVVQECPGVVSIVVEGRDLHELQAESGQFFRWRFLTPDSWMTAHPFSLSAPPTSTHLRLTVKSLGDGSLRLQDVEPGTWVVAEGPYGAMTAERRTRQHVLLVAGGVGITPMRALFETLPVAPHEDLVLLYCARGPDDVVFRDELETVAARRGVRVQYVLGGEPLTVDLLQRVAPGLAERDVYFCGPPGLSAALRRTLRAAGLDLDRQFHEERFRL